MRTRTFIGMILLILVLMVASTPALLDVVAIGVQKAAVRVGLPGVPAPATAAKKPSTKAATGAGTVSARLELKGYLVGKPDLRDSYSTAERAAIESNRLGSGAHRQLLSNQLKDSTLKSDPIPGVNGVLLDSVGCPRFAVGDDVVALMADPTIAANYNAKVAAADDPAGCSTAFAARVAAADPSKQVTSGTSAMGRRYSTRQLDSMDLPDLLIELQGIELLSGMFGTRPSSTKAATSVSDALQ
jgi:hypothetical protein